METGLRPVVALGRRMDSGLRRNDGALRAPSAVCVSPPARRPLARRARLKYLRLVGLTAGQAMV